MACIAVRLPDGTSAIVSGRWPERRCCVCGRRAEYLCDAPKGRRTCDRALCDRHRTRAGPDRDLCPDHGPQGELVLGDVIAGRPRG